MRAELLGGGNYNFKHPIIISRNNSDIMEESKQPIPLTAEDTTNASTTSPIIPIIDPEELLIGHTFLLEKQANCQQFRARITKLIENHSFWVEDNKDCI